ncbi:hypothetical protein J7J26_02650 [Candidatus Micrarchaeota archaeon]|nr:hypothetical protein [Candidatus Micrarchaeota archaeon]
MLLRSDEGMMFKSAKLLGIAVLMFIFSFIIYLLAFLNLIKNDILSGIAFILLIGFFVFMILGLILRPREEVIRDGIMSNEHGKRKG